jgi:hypothetical protein
MNFRPCRTFPNLDFIIIQHKNQQCKILALHDPHQHEWNVNHNRGSET